MVGTRIALLLVLPLAVAACSKEVTAPVTSEPLLAQQSQGIADEVLSSTRTTFESLLQHTLDALHHHPDAEAQACLDQARDLHHQARTAHDAGDLELAAQLAHQSFLKVLCAVVEVFPDAPARTGLAADEAIARIEHWLGNREAPHIRQVLAHVKELRSEAVEEVGAGNDVEALALNLRAIQILHRLANHLSEHHDHDDVANSELYAIDY